MTRVIKGTVDHVHVHVHDIEELSDLLMELRDEVGKEFLDPLLDLELLAGKFLIDGFQEGGGALLPLIEERRLKLETSQASLTKLLRVKVLLRVKRQYSPGQYPPGQYPPMDNMFFPSILRGHSIRSFL